MKRTTKFGIGAIVLAAAGVGGVSLVTLGPASAAPATATPATTTLVDDTDDSSTDATTDDEATDADDNGDPFSLAEIVARVAAVTTTDDTPRPACQPPSEHPC